MDKEIEENVEEPTEVLFLDITKIELAFQTHKDLFDRLRDML